MLLWEHYQAVVLQGRVYDIKGKKKKRFLSHSAHILGFLRWTAPPKEKSE